MKRPLTKSILLFLVVLSLLLLGLAPSRDMKISDAKMIKTDPEISAIVSDVNSSNILEHRNHDAELRDPANPLLGRTQEGAGVTAARDFVFKQYSAISGLQVRLDQFTHPNCASLANLQRDCVAWETP